MFNFWVWCYRRASLTHVYIYIVHCWNKICMTKLVMTNEIKSWRQDIIRLTRYSFPPILLPPLGNSPLSPGKNLYRIYQPHTHTLTHLSTHNHPSSLSLHRSKMAKRRFFVASGHGRVETLWKVFYLSIIPTKRVAVFNYHGQSVWLLAAQWTDNWEARKGATIGPRQGPLEGLAGSTIRPRGERQWKPISRMHTAMLCRCALCRVARFGLFEAKKLQIWPFLYRLAWTFFRIY